MLNFQFIKRILQKAASGLAQVMKREFHKDQTDMDFNKEEPTKIDIVQSKKSDIFNHLEDELSMPRRLQFCLLTSLLRMLPIVLFFEAAGIKILGFTLVLITASVDFWTLKNIAGKELVGMVWWMKVDPENGNEEWVFHSNQGYKLDKMNEAVFWGCLLFGNVFWGLTTLLCMMLSSLFWISLCSFCFLLSVLNFACFMKCKGKHNDKMKDFAEEMGLQSARKFVDY